MPTWREVIDDEVMDRIMVKAKSYTRNALRGFCSFLQTSIIPASLRISDRGNYTRLIQQIEMKDRERGLYIRDRNDFMDIHQVDSKTCMFIYLLQSLLCQISYDDMARGTHPKGNTIDESIGNHFKRDKEFLTNIRNMEGHSSYREISKIVDFMTTDTPLRYFIRNRFPEVALYIIHELASENTTGAYELAKDQGYEDVMDALRPRVAPIVTRKRRGGRRRRGCRGGRGGGGNWPATQSVEPEMQVVVPEMLALDALTPEEIRRRKRQLSKKLREIEGIAENEREELNYDQQRKLESREKITEELNALVALGQ